MSDIVPVSPAPAARPGLDLSAAITSATALGKDGVEVLERLHAILKDERASNARAAFTKAMAAFRADMPAVRKTVAGAHGASRAGTRTKGLYAPLDAITPVLDPIAARHGLTYRFDRTVVDGKDYILCIVSHEDGHEVVSRFPAPADTGPGRNAIQAIASGETYAKRYALIAAFGITTADPDDDGDAAGVSDGTITDEQAANLQALAEEVGADRAKFLAWAGVERLSNLPASRLNDAIRMLEAKRRGPR